MFLFEDDPGKNKYIEIAYKVHYKIACNFYINKVININNNIIIIIIIILL